LGRLIEEEMKAKEMVLYIRTLPTIILIEHFY
jgi:hypothetical protein